MAETKNHYLNAIINKLKDEKTKRSLLEGSHSAFHELLENTLANKTVYVGNIPTPNFYYDSEKNQTTLLIYSSSQGFSKLLIFDGDQRETSLDKLSSDYYGDDKPPIIMEIIKTKNNNKPVEIVIQYENNVPRYYTKKVDNKIVCTIQKDFINGNTSRIIINNPLTKPMGAISVMDVNHTDYTIAVTNSKFKNIDSLQTDNPNHSHNIEQINISEFIEPTSTYNNNDADYSQDVSTYDDLYGFNLTDSPVDDDLPWDEDTDDNDLPWDEDTDDNDLPWDEDTDEIIEPTEEIVEHTSSYDATPDENIYDEETAENVYSYEGSLVTNADYSDYIPEPPEEFEEDPLDVDKLIEELKNSCKINDDNPNM